MPFCIFINDVIVMSSSVAAKGKNYVYILGEMCYTIATAAPGRQTWAGILTEECAGVCWTKTVIQGRECPYGCLLCHV